jgi:hypothetical protein
VVVELSNFLKGLYSLYEPMSVRDFLKKLFSVFCFLLCFPLIINEKTVLSSVSCSVFP